MGNTYPIFEIFDSVQGEGFHVGLPGTFIRLTGCNLHCDWCDTKKTWEVKKEQYQPIQDIISKIKRRYVIITGGEPTLYDLKPLCNQIKDKCDNLKKICVETNGTNQIANDTGIDWITCSPKPESGYRIECVPNELKYVVDREFKPEIIPKKYHYQIPIWLQPNWQDLQWSTEKAISLVMKNDHLRLGFQLHKYYHIK